MINFEKKYIIIKCPDFGEIEIQSDICLGQIADFLDNCEKEPKKSVIELLQSCIKNKNITVEDFTEKDILCLLKYYSKILGIEKDFNEYLKSDVIIELAFKKSYYKKEKEWLKKSFPHFGNFAQNISYLPEYLNTFKAVNIENILGSNYLSHIQSLKNSITSSTKYFNSFAQIEQTFSLPISTKFFAMQQNQINNLFHTQNNLFQNYKSTLFSSIELFNSKIKDETHFMNLDIFKNRFNSLSNIQNNISGFINKFKAESDLIANYKKSYLKLNEFINSTSKIVNSANKIVSNTHNYFISEENISSIIHKNTKTTTIIKEIQNNITDSIDHSEHIVQDETGLVITNTNDLISQIRDIIEEKFKEKFDNKYSKLFERFNFLLNPPDLLTVLSDFCNLISRDYWQHFWTTIGDKYVNFPERLAKSNLGLYLNGKFNEIAFVGQEIIAGNGFIDLFINFMGINHIIELKMLGAGWAFSWAKSGLNQLDQYMKRYNQNISYLISLCMRIKKV